MKGSLALFLHHHLPFVRHPEHEFFLEERWLYEAITETYLPLIEVWRRLERDQIPFLLSISVSPPLTNMLKDDLLISRYRQHLLKLEELAESEVERTRKDPQFAKIARFYQERFRRLSALFEALDGDIIAEYARLQEAGYLEILTCTATHGFLPLMNRDRGALWAQIKVAVDDYEEHFGRRPPGIWLAECGYDPGLDELLAEAGLRYFFVDTHSIHNASSKPIYGVFAPLICPRSRVAAFGRDPESSKQVWSAQEGYPGDFHYREYYRDIGYDLDMEYIFPYIHPDGIRVNTGLKYHRNTGKTDFKEVYDPEKALERADEHAANFMFNRQAQVRYLDQHMDRPPLILSPYDAELFGHWWFEGPDFLEALFRHLHADQDELELSTPSRYLQDYPLNQEAWPGMSSWGDGGYGRFWCDEQNEWLYSYLHQAATRMGRLAQQLPDAKGLLEQALNQAARECLLAQSSDWAFIMQTGTMVEYAIKRSREHLSAFHQLYGMIEAHLKEEVALDEAYIQSRAAQWCIFPKLDYRVFDR